MTTAQEVLTNSFPPFPFFVENPVELERHDLPAKNNNHNSNLGHVHIDTNPLPDRCQFFFSDGRQCTMPRSDIHPSLCRYHSEREDQLFGEPGSRTVGAALDLPELYSACRDLTTAAGVNRALAQVFRLLAQRRISQKEAATFGHLAQLLLRSISAMRAEYLAATDRVPHLETSPPPQLAANPDPSPSLEARTSTGRAESVPTPDVSRNRHAESAESKPRRISSYENTELKIPQNQHLHKNNIRLSATPGSEAELCRRQAPKLQGVP